MGEWYKELDERIARDVIPPEYSRRKSRVLCHDCDMKTVVPFHFVYHKCGNGECGGYNTRVLEQFDVDDEGDGGGPAGESSRAMAVGEGGSGVAISALESVPSIEEAPLVGGRS